MGTGTSSDGIPIKTCINKNINIEYFNEAFKVNDISINFDDSIMYPKINLGKNRKYNLNFLYNSSYYNRYIVLRDINTNTDINYRYISSKLSYNLQSNSDTVRLYTYNLDSSLYENRLFLYSTLFNKTICYLDIKDYCNIPETIFRGPNFSYDKYLKIQYKSGVGENSAYIIVDFKNSNVDNDGYSYAFQINWDTYSEPAW